MWLYTIRHPLPLPQPPHRYHPHQAAAAASSGLQRCRRVGCCLLNLSLLTSTQHFGFRFQFHFQFQVVAVVVALFLCRILFEIYLVKISFHFIIHPHIIVLGVRPLATSFWALSANGSRVFGVGSQVFGSWLSGSLAHKTHEFTSKRRFGTCVMFEYISFFPLSASVWAFFNFFPYCIIFYRY